MINKNKDRGITLVALVITIIILLILATISIQSLTNTGLFQKANEAKEKTKNATENQAKTLNEYEDELNKYISGDIKTPVKKVADNIGSVLSTTENTELEDAYGNKIVVPAGFKIVSNSDTSNATTVDKGIVIEDATVDSEGKATATNGSQFVWVPVGKIYTDASKTEANAKTITLGRYDFDETTGIESAYSGSYIEEDVNDASTLTNFENKAIAKNITKFKNSVLKNEGYYIGRYEARTIKQRNAKEDTLTQITEKGTDQVYNYVTQLQSAQQSQNMYNNKFTSDLMNSYAWDTAIIFIQKCTDQTKYSRQNSLNSGSISQTGTTTDKQCNIFDMASNLREWTTETTNVANNTCVSRGGYYSNSYDYTSYRCHNGTSDSSSLIGFRPIIYIND